MEKNILEKIFEYKNIEDTKELINKYFPNWLITYLDDYSSDYPHLKGNWNFICNKNSVQPQKIVLVAKITFETTNMDLNRICDFMTEKGYVVRREGEFIPCIVCNKAIPCKEIWFLLKGNGFPVPENWNNKCSTC